VSNAVTVIEVIRTRVVKVNRQLYEAQSKHAGVKLEVLLGFTAMAVM
jgi:hypothetical protein